MDIDNKKFTEMDDDNNDKQKEKNVAEEDAQFDKLVDTGQSSPMAQESDYLVGNAIPCGHYQAMDKSGPNPMEDIKNEQENPLGERKKHRRKRMRYVSQGSAAGALCGRRPTYSGHVGKRNRKRLLYGPSAPPRHVHCNDWREMLEITKHNIGENAPLAFYPLHRSEENLDRGEELRAIEEFPSGSLQLLDNEGGIRDRDVARMRYLSGGSSMQCDWIEQTFSKRECIEFIPSSRDSNKCGCGRYRNQHTAPDDLQRRDEHQHETRAKRWSIQKHTTLEPTDAYGTVEFQGGPHPFKAQYLRLSFDSEPADIMCLFEHIWQIEPPKLIITIHGGITNFDLQPKLARVFRKGLLKAARTTGAWIFTSGINAGAVRQVAAALESAIPSSKSHKIVSVGITPWGLLKKREDFIGRDKVVLYHPQSFPPKTRFAVLNNRHSFFLLVDNGTVGRYGADIILRRHLESYIAEKQKIGGGNRSVPVVCVVLEGGTCTIRTVLDYVTTIPKVPVVICDGSGRASDLLAFAHQYIQEDGNLPEVIRPQLLDLIEDVFYYDKHNAQCLVMDILACVRQRNMITVFRLGENQKQDVDYAIFTALLKGHNLSPAEQLSLALAWNRVDIARSDIFIMGQDWPKHTLHNAMMEALVHNRVDFVRLLLENGVSMHAFLTIARLEELYNTDQGPPNTLYYIVRDVVKIRAGYRYKLPHIGMAIEKLMANGFRSHYTSAQFRHKYNEYKNKLKESQRHNHHHPIHHPDTKLATSSTNGSEFVTTRGLRAALPTSASDTRIGFSREPLNKNQTVQPKTSRLNNYADQASPFSQHQHYHSTANFSSIPTISGSRALSNHILWRTTYRRDNNPAAAKHPTMGVRNAAAKSPPLAQSQSAYQFSTLNENGFINEAIGYAAEADESLNIDGEQRVPDFRYPFSDLLIWAVLTKRHEMALCMWQHGEEAMAKALVACRLYKSLANEAAEDYLEVEVCEELKKYAEEFRQHSQDLLDHCYKQDDAQTLQLLTYELYYWGQETCLSLAVIVNNKAFLAHPCCQILLADLWHGGLRIRSNSNLKVILGILFPPSIFLLEFKSREELMLQPQTAAEHQDDINDTSSSSESSSSSSSSSESGDSEIDAVDTDYGAEKGAAPIGDRRRSHGSVQSLNFTSIFQSKRKRNRTIAGAGATDLEMSKTKQRDADKTAKEEKRTRTKSSRPASSTLIVDRENGKENGKGSPMRGGALAMAVHTTLGTANAINGTGNNPQKSSQNLSSPAQTQTNAPPVTPLHIDTSNVAYHPNQRQQKSTPQFTLGSIGENVGVGEEDDGSVSIMSTPKHLQNRAPVETAIGDQYITSTDNSPNHHGPHASATHSPLSKFATPPRFDMGRNMNLAKAVDHLNRLTANGGYVPKGIPLPEGVTLNKKRQIKFRRKLYEFFVAPITTFWAWTLSFVVFLSILTYVLLIRTPPKPTLLEWYLLAYVVAFGIEIGRKFIMSEPKKLREKFGYYFGNHWNFLTAIAIIGFIIGFIFRMNPSTSKTVGRIILAVDSVLWTIKLLDFLGVFPRFGPYITMAGKMIMNMSSIVVMLGISLLGFGLARQSITYPNEEWHWLLLRNVFYKPYFMLYGEVYADEIDTCGDEAWDEHLDKNVSIANAWTHRDDRDRELACVPGHWIPPILMTVFLLIANILLISMLIAIFNNIFESTNKISQQIWLFQRYRQVMEYEATPFLPPPFTPIYHLYMIFKYLNYRRCRLCVCFSPHIGRMLGTTCFCICLKRRKNKNPEVDTCEDKSKEKPPPLGKNAFEQRRNLQQGRNTQERLALFDFSLKLFLTQDQIEKLHDFEEECMEDLAREKEYERNRTNEERLHRTCERTEMILSRVNDLSSKETMLKGNVREMENRIEVMENKQTEMLEYLRQLTSMMPSLVQSLHTLQQQQLAHGAQSPYTNESQLNITVGGTSEIGAMESHPIMPARSEGHIFSTKHDSRAKEQYDRTKEHDTDSLQQIKPQLLSSVSVDHSADSTATGLATPASLLPLQNRHRHAETHGSTLECQQRGTTLGSSPGSSMTTVYYPPKCSGGSGGRLESTSFGAGEFTAQRRTRTTTIGADSDIHSPTNPRLFGSMISLDPNLTGTPVGAGIIQSRRNTQRRHRHNEEYTSITDTINVEELTTKLAAQGFGAETSEKYIKEEEEEGTPGHRLADDDVQTEEEDEEDLVEEEYDEAEDEMDEDDGMSSTEQSSRSPKKRAKSKESSAKEQQPQVAIEIDSASLYYDAEMPETLTRRSSYEYEGDFGQSMGTEDGGAGAFQRVGTPNSTLRRARSSFIRQQNILFKNYEEDVGQPANRIVKKRKSLVALDKRRPTSEIHKEKKQRKGESSSSSKEFISFEAQSSRGDHQTHCQDQHE